MIEINCEECGKLTKKQPHQIKDNAHHFCGATCSAVFRNRRRGLKHINNVECSWCKKPLSRSPWYLKTNPNHFCNRSCSTYHRNANKTKANKRSKLELWLSDQLKTNYDLDFVFNDSSAIGCELDIYIPSLRLAFEINGIYHYEPIHGSEYLDKIKIRDENKFQKCFLEKISLCVINTSDQKYFTENSSKKYLDIITSIIDESL